MTELGVTLTLGWSILWILPAIVLLVLALTAAHEAGTQGLPSRSNASTIVGSVIVAASAGLGFVALLDKV